MSDKNLDWCYEGGCTYMADADAPDNDADASELEALYHEPCSGIFD